MTEKHGYREWRQQMSDEYGEFLDEKRERQEMMEAGRDE